MSPKFTALVIVLFLVGVWFSPVSIGEQFEQRVKLVVLVVVFVTAFAAGFTVGRHG